jgi:hypothetical protein
MWYVPLELIVAKLVILGVVTLQAATPWMVDKVERQQNVALFIYFEEFALR